MIANVCKLGVHLGPSAFLSLVTAHLDLGPGEIKICLVCWESCNKLFFSISSKHLADLGNSLHEISRTMEHRSSTRILHDQHKGVVPASQGLWLHAQLPWVKPQRSSCCCNATQCPISTFLPPSPSSFFRFSWLFLCTCFFDFFFLWDLSPPMELP